MSTVGKWKVALVVVVVLLLSGCDWPGFVWPPPGVKVQVSVETSIGPGIKDVQIMEAYADPNHTGVITLDSGEPLILRYKENDLPVTLTPTKDGFTFEPESVIVTEAMDVTFIARPVE